VGILNESEIAMSLTPSPFLLTSLKASTRSLLFPLGIDLALIDFLAHAAIGAGTVLLAILFVSIRVPRRFSSASRDTRRYPHPPSYESPCSSESHAGQGLPTSCRSNVQRTTAL
jgi:hypothetical protein